MASLSIDVLFFVPLRRFEALSSRVEQAALTPAGDLINSVERR